MKQTCLVLSLGYLFGGVCTLAQEQVHEGPPNIVFILADDLGYGDLGCYGQEKIKTPNLDLLAEEGLRFTSHYAGQTVCAPSRCSLMTGMDSRNISVRNNSVSSQLKEEDITVAMLLQRAGYVTGMIGKWGMGGRPGHPASPNNKGFDYFFGFDNQGYAHFYYPEFLWRNNEKVIYSENEANLRLNGEYIPGKGVYVHDEFTREALQFIERNADNPFFLYLPYTIPHAELTVPEDSMAPYLELGWPETPRIEGEGKIGGRAGEAGYGSQYTRGYCGQSHPNATYAGMISRMDADVGKILDLLERLNLDGRTLVIFSSDNGPSDEGGQDINFFKSAGPLRGQKRSLYEGGIRVPFIAKWPGHIAAGTVSDHPSAFWDFLPTVCELVGIDSPACIDGISFLPELLGKTEQQEKHEFMYWEWNNEKALRFGKWKVFLSGDGILELYDLENDLGEQTNLAERSL